MDPELEQECGLLVPENGELSGVRVIVVSTRWAIRGTRT